ncbi:serine hydrolase [Streptomyces sp. NPDC059697]|uniref:serine hydrolase n=1 Tax=Streptomyces sp. NPDC059697 TaxID=3346912 RepID=UPI00368151DC
MPNPLPKPDPNPNPGSASGLHDLLKAYVDEGTVPGAVGLVARGDTVEVRAVGTVDVEGSAPMARDSIFRIASISKPITAAPGFLPVSYTQLSLASIF